MNSFWDTLDSLSGTVGGVLSSQYQADAAKKLADAAAAKAKPAGATDWSKIAIIGGIVVAVLAVCGFIFSRK